MPRNVFEEMKYLELMIVSDHSMVRFLAKGQQNNRKYLRPPLRSNMNHLVAVRDGTSCPGSLNNVSQSVHCVILFLFVTFGHKREQTS